MLQSRSIHVRFTNTCYFKYNLKLEPEKNRIYDFGCNGITVLSTSESQKKS